MRDRRSSELSDLLDAQPGLRWRPLVDDNYGVAGAFFFAASHPSHGLLEDSFEIGITLLPDYPASFPVVTETAGRIPVDFHRHPDASLCLASPARLRLIRSSNLTTFLEKTLVPYLYNFVCRERYGTLPFGELSHGYVGILEDFVDLFKVRSTEVAVQMLQLATVKNKIANKVPCPCGSGRRFGKCHHRAVANCKETLGQSWLRKHFDKLMAEVRGLAASGAGKL